jgi:hypothetical protein
MTAKLVLAAAIVPTTLRDPAPTSTELARPGVSREFSRQGCMILPVVATVGRLYPIYPIRQGEPTRATKA